MQNNKGSYRNKIAFVKTAAKDMLALNESIARFSKGYAKLEASFNNPKSVFDPKKLAKCAKALDRQMEFFQNKLSAQEQAFRKALAMNVPTKAIEDSTRKLSALITRIALLKAVAETSLSSEDMLEIDENGYLVKDKESGCGDTKKAESGCGDTKKKVKADEDKEEEHKEEEKEEAPAEEGGEEPSKEEETPAEGEPSEEETPAEEGEELLEEDGDKPVTQEELDSINEDVMAEIFGLTERVENMEEQLGIEPTVKASVQTSVKTSAKDNAKVQQMKLASASKKEATVQTQDVLDTIVSMEIR